MYTASWHFLGLHPSHPIPLSLPHHFLPRDTAPEPICPHGQRIQARPTRRPQRSCRKGGSELSSGVKASSSHGHSHGGSAPWGCLRSCPCPASMAKWTGIYPQPPAVASPSTANSTASSPAASASRMEACRNRSVPSWHSCCQPSVGRSSRLRSRLGRAVWPRAWVSSRCAGREKGLVCRANGPDLAC